MNAIRMLMKTLRRLFIADPVEEFLGEWATEIEQEETAARKRRNNA